MKRVSLCLALLAPLALGCAGAADVPFDGGGADLRAPDLPFASQDIPAPALDVPDLSAPPDVASALPDLVDEAGGGLDTTDTGAPPAPWPLEGLGPHPRLFFSAADLPALRARAQLAEGPHARLYAGLQSLAAGDWLANDGERFDHRLSIHRGQCAEAAAFVGLIEQDAELLAKAAQMLAAPFTLPLQERPGDNYGINEAEALVGWCSAYDLVAGSEDLDEALREQARARLVERVTVYRQVVTSPFFLAIHAAVFNNHPAKVLSAMGLCALALDDHPQAALDLHDGLTGWRYVFRDFQSTPDGGFGEGWNYLVYGDNNYLPFLAAYHRHARGRTLPFVNVGSFTAARDPLVGTVVELLDPVADPAIRVVYERALQSAQPDGLLPNTDDANPSPLHGGLLAALLDDGRFLHNWLRPAVGARGGRTALATFAMLDPAMVPVAPDWPADQVHPEAGFALLRSDLGEEALWLLLQGEHGTARLAGMGHEHPDATNLLLWYLGEPLLIDPGYIDWTNHGLVRQARDHNLILVDGEGPPYPALGANVGVDAFLEEWTEGPRLTSVVSRARWARVDVSRRVVRVDGRFFVLADRLDPEADASHTYAFQMNGMGGGDLGEGSFGLLENGAWWQGQRAAVELRVLPLADTATWGRRLEEHATGHGTWAWHEMLVVEAEMTGPAGFLTLVLPRAVEEAPPALELSHDRRAGALAILRWPDREYQVRFERGPGGLVIEADDEPLGVF